MKRTLKARRASGGAGEGDRGVYCGVEHQQDLLHKGNEENSPQKPWITPRGQWRSSLYSSTVMKEPMFQLTEQRQ